MTVTRPSPFADADRDDVAAFRSVFDSAGYDEQGLATVAVDEGRGLDDDQERAVMLHRTRGGSPLDSMIRLFTMGETVGGAVVEEALAPIPPEVWERNGLLRSVEGGYRATLKVRPVMGRMVATDFVVRPLRSVPDDFVMAISQTTATLAGMTVRGPVGPALDLGTGQGMQALMLADHAQSVTATDVNRRALAVARLNALLNDADVEFLEGSLFEPVAGRRFDRIVSNPPFIMATRPTHQFLHAGLGGDSLFARLVEEAPGHLTEGGICQFLSNWLVPMGGDWRSRLAPLLADSGCDAWVLMIHTTPIELYAATWETGGALGDADLFATRVEALRAGGFDEVAYGLVVLRRRSDGRSVVTLEDMPPGRDDLCGDEVLAGLDIRSRLAVTGDDELLASTVVLADGVVLAEQAVAADGRWSVASRMVRRTTGFHWTGTMDDVSSALLARTGSPITVLGLSETLAGIIGVEEQAVRADVVANVRSLLRMGILEFV